MPFQPSLDRVLVRVDQSEQTTASGLLVSVDVSKDRAVVVAVGPGPRYWDFNNARLVQVDPLYKVGDKVRVPTVALPELKVDGETLYILKEDQVLGKET